MSAISSTYFHKFSVNRMGYVTNEFGQEVPDYAPVETLQNLKCGFSQFSKSKKNQSDSMTDTANVIVNTPKLFCSPEFELKIGDRITIYSGSRNVGEFVADYPYIYPTHQEVPLYRKVEG